jgi:phospholipid/cholesterol/gamma-HCH transport system substrate-binding protein
MTANRLIGVGAFVVGGVGLFALGLFLIGERRLIFRDRFIVYAEFADIGGLQRGAKVRVAGADAGEVERMEAPAGPPSRFRVRMRVTEDLHGLVRTDSVATIQTDGLVGNKFVQIDAGTAGAPELADGGTIASREPFDLTDLMERASETITTINAIVAELRANIDVAVTNVAEAAEHADALIEGVSGDVKFITTSGARVARDVEAITAGIREGRGTLGKLLSDDEIYTRAKQIAADAERTVQNVRDATAEAKAVVARFQAKDGPAQSIAADLRVTIDQAREAMSDLSENTEALKRNWFFRGFFDRRGYFDLNALDASTYRGGAALADRRALRIWLQASVVFTPGSTPSTLTEGGRTRVDSAMATFLGFPSDSPLVVEGYAEEGSGDERFLRARDRAALVREYIISRFHLDPNRVGLVPLGPEAPGSPRGDDRWEGIALALFVGRTSDSTTVPPESKTPASTSR